VCATRQKEEIESLGLPIISTEMENDVVKFIDPVLLHSHSYQYRSTVRRKTTAADAHHVLRVRGGPLH
jgi:hypothetical protein